MRRQRIPNKAAAEEAWNNLPEKIKMLYANVESRVPSSPVVSMTPQQKETADRLLYDSTDVLSRMDTLAQWFVQVPNQEKVIPTLFAMVCTSSPHCNMVFISLTNFLLASPINEAIQTRPGVDC